MLSQAIHLSRRLQRIKPTNTVTIGLNDSRKSTYKVLRSLTINDNKLSGTGSQDNYLSNASQEEILDIDEQEETRNTQRTQREENNRNAQPQPIIIIQEETLSITTATELEDQYWKQVYDIRRYFGKPEIHAILTRETVEYHYGKLSHRDRT